LTLRFFAYSELYKRFQHDVNRFLNEYLRDQNEDLKNHPEKIGQKEAQFKRMIGFVKRHFANGFAKTKTATATPRVRFEALSVGVHLALEQNPKLVPRDMSWLESDEFKRQTTTHASNSGPKLRARIQFVRDSLLGGK